MGHATVTAATAEAALEKAQFVRKNLKIKSLT